MDEPGRHHRLTSATDVVAAGLDQLGGDLGRIVAAWPLVVGDELAGVSTPAGLRHGTLRVRCASASWAQALNGMELQIVDSIAARLGAGLVQRVTARAGGPAPRLQDDPRVVREAPPPPLAPERRRQLEALVASIDDPALRERMLHAAIATERRRLESRER